MLNSTLIRGIVIVAKFTGVASFKTDSMHTFQVLLITSVLTIKFFANNTDVAHLSFIELKKLFAVRG